MHSTEISESPPTDATHRYGPSVKKPHVVAAVIFSAATAAAFGWPTRHGDFLMGDDQRFVTEHVYVNHPTFRNAWKLLTIAHGDLWQPLPMLSFQANYAMAEPAPESRFGVSARIFHLTNIALHAINAGLACLVALALSRRTAIALLTGVMFACHPFALESVAWVNGRMMLLATTFALATLLICFRRPDDGRGGWPIRACMTWLLSLGSKVIPTVPIVAAWYDRRRTGRLPRRAWFTYAVLLALAILAGAFAAGTTSEAGFAQDIELETGTGATARLLLACRYYVENYAWPTRLSPWAPPPLDISVASLPVFVAIFELAVLFALIVWSRQNAPLAFTGLIIFALLLVPFLAASVSRRLLAADRYMYMPIFGLHFALSAALVQLFQKSDSQPGLVFARASTVAATLMLIAAWMGIACRLAPCWRDTVRLHERVAEVYPDHVLAHDALAKACLFANEPNRALKVAEAARRKWPDHPRLAAQAGEAYYMLNEWPKAAVELRRAAKAMPHHVRTQYFLALTLRELKQRDDAQSILQGLQENHPSFLPAISTLAAMHDADGRRDQAIASYERVLEMNPHHRNALLRLAALYAETHAWRKAETLLRRAQELDENDRQAAFQLAVCWFQQGRFQEALVAYDDLLVYDPANTAIRLNRGQVLIVLQRPQEAERAFREILRDRPGEWLAAVELHELLQSQGRNGELLELWNAFSQVAPPTPKLQLYLAWTHALNGDFWRARRAADSIPPPSREYPYAKWIDIYEALGAHDDELLRKRLDSGNVPIQDVENVASYGRLVSRALLALPEPVRRSPAGQYTLARLFLLTGQADHAIETARQLVRTRPMNDWTHAAQKLLNDLQAANSASTRPTERESTLDRRD